MLEALYPILSQTLLLSALISSIYWLRGYLIGIVVLSLGILMIPLETLPIWYYIRATIGDLSISTSIICGWFLWGHYQARCPSAIQQTIKPEQLSIKFHPLARDWSQLCLLYSLLGLILYPMALGWLPYDAYALGYQHWLLISLVSFLALIYFFYQKPFLSFLFASILIGYALQLLESTNLWDYLIDPLLFALCAFHILKILPLMLLRGMIQRYN